VKEMVANVLGHCKQGDLDDGGFCEMIHLIMNYFKNLTGGVPCNTSIMLQCVVQITSTLMISIKIQFHSVQILCMLQQE
jgi:hypothetical protein